MPPVDLQELDVVELLADARGDEGEMIPAGSQGTIVGAWRSGAFIVEFTEPVDTLADLKPAVLKFVSRCPS